PASSASPVGATDVKASVFMDCTSRRARQRITVERQGRMVAQIRGIVIRKSTQPHAAPQYTLPRSRCVGGASRLLRFLWMNDSPSAGQHRTARGDAPADPTTFGADVIWHRCSAEEAFRHLASDRCGLTAEEAADR